MLSSKGLLFGLSAICISTLSALQTDAAIQAQYTFDTALSSDTDTTTDASAVTFGSGSMSIVNAGGSFGNAAVISVTNANQFVSNSINDGNYLQFEIGPASGVSSFSIDKVTYTHHLTDTTDGPLYTTYLFSSIGGGLVAGNEIASNTITGDGNPLTEEVTFVAPSAYDNLTGPVTFWLLAVDNTSSNFHVIDNIIVEGTPEPTSLAVLGVLGLFVISRRRRTA